MKKLLVFFAILSLLQVACTPKNNTNQPSTTNNPTKVKPEEVVKAPMNHPQEPEPKGAVADPSDPMPKTLLHLNRSGCYGNCPSFEVTVQMNGTATYVGKKNAPRTGEWTATADYVFFQKIEQQAIAAGYFDFSNSYPTDGKFITDIPFTTIYVHLGGKFKKVIDNFDSPLALQNFEKYLEAQLETLSWKKMN